MVVMNIQRPDWLVGVLLLVCADHALAIGNFKPSPAELASLPAFCAVRAQPYGNQPGHPEVKPWLSIYGQDWIHMHHYCSGLNAINRSYRSANRKEKENALQNAVSEFDYTLRNISQNTRLSAEVFMARGQALLGLGRTPAANRDLEQALVIDPSLRRAYGLLADSYIALKQRDKALQVISEGIRHNPESTSLKRRYDELGGIKPYPPAYMAASPEEALSTEAPSALVKQIEPESVKDAGGIGQPTPAERPSEAPVAAPNIGSPTNPYCRFCP